MQWGCWILTSENEYEIDFEITNHKDQIKKKLGNKAQIVISIPRYHGGIT